MYEKNRSFTICDEIQRIFEVILALFLFWSGRNFGSSSCNVLGVKSFFSDTVYRRATSFTYCINFVQKLHTDDFLNNVGMKGSQMENTVVYFNFLILLEI